jgi:hypothetical protein
MASYDIIKAILSINPDAKVSVGDSLDQITWLDGTTPISKADIQAQMPTEFDTAMEDLRAKRNRLLAETDHLALSDQTLSTEMTNYRQSLRNITDGLTTKAQVDAVTWPTKPGA